MPRLAIVGVLAAAVLAIYAPGLRFPFVFDDGVAILHNESIRSLASAWSPPVQIPLSGRPVANFSFALNYALSGFEPASYRGLNIALHLLNAVLVLAIVRRILLRPVIPQVLRDRADGLSAAVALLFAVHPLQTEAVMYVTQRTELLAAACYLLALYAALRDMASERSGPWAGVAVVAFALGIGCKEVVVSAPLLIALLDHALFCTSWRQCWERRRALYLGLVLAELVFALMVVSAPHGVEIGAGHGVTSIEYLAVQGSVISGYLKQVFVPYPLSISYPWPQIEPLSSHLLADTWIATLFLLTLVAWRARPWLGLPGLFCFAVLAPSSSFVPVLTEPIAERRMYLPLCALLGLICAAVCVLLARLPQSLQRWAGMCLLGGGVLALVSVSAARVQDYRSALVLWQDTLSKQPDDPVALWGNGDALEALGRHAEAVAYYERMAARRFPYHGPASWGTRGLFAASRVYAALGDEQRASATVDRALRHDPQSAVGKLYRASVLERAGEPRRAIELLQGMLAQPFLLDRVHLGLSAAYMQLGDRANAEAHATEARRLAQTLGTSEPLAARAR